MRGKKIRVLIVDDSLFFREFLAQRLGADSGIEVLGTASDPYQARDKIIELQPDVLTLDVEMPRMNGIEFVRQLMPQYPLPIVMVTSVSEKIFEALQAGAVDFVTKPAPNNKQALDAFISQLIIKVKIASVAKLGHWKKEEKTVASGQKGFDDKIIAIGASTGGTEAIYSILKQMPRDIPGTVIVQHMPPVFTGMYAERLNNSCLMEVKEAENGDRVIPGRVLIAPGDYQMKVRKRGNFYTVECYKGEKVNGHCPSVDVLFHSIAEQVGPQAIGVILTGMGYDGAKGLLAMRKRGARTVGQDESSCVVYGMPKVAFDLGGVEKQASLEQIPQIIYSLLNRRWKR